MSFITESLFGKEQEAGKTPTGFESLPDEAKELFLGLIPQAEEAIAGGAAAQAGLTPEQLALINRVTNLAGTGVAVPKLGFSKAATNLFGQSQGFFGGVDPLVQRGAADITAEEINALTSQLQNPFLRDVLDPAIQDIRDEEARQFSDISSLASTRGAFGGNRQTLGESELRRGTQREVGRLSGTLRSQARTTALQNALQNLQFGRGQALAGAGVLTGAGGAAAQAGAGAANAAVQNQLAAREKRALDIQNTLAGFAPAGLVQQQIQGDIQQPIRELDLLRQIALSFPTGGGGTGGTAATSGLFGTGGTFNLGGTITPGNIQTGTF